MPAVASSTSRRKRHHYLPEGYLKAWADDNGRVAARKRDLPGSFVTGTKNVALEANLYSINMGDYWDDSLEVALSETVEADLPALLEELRTRRAPKRGTDQRRAIAELVAIQHVRTPARIGQVLFSTVAREAIGQYPMTDTAMREYLTGLYGQEPTDGEVRGAVDYANFDQKQPPTKADALQMLIEIALGRIAPFLEQRAWRVEVCWQGRFITTDRPIGLWHARPAPFEGIGLESAHEVRFPLGPNHLLVIGRGRDDRYVVDGHRAAEVNRHLARGCHKLLITHLDDQEMLDQIELATLGPAMRYVTGRELAPGPRGALVDTGREILHMYVPTDVP